jgi:hypothetical protein
VLIGVEIFAIGIFLRRICLLKILRFKNEGEEVKKQADFFFN